MVQRSETVGQADHIMESPGWGVGKAVRRRGFNIAGKHPRNTSDRSRGADGSPNSPGGPANEISNVFG